MEDQRFDELARALAAPITRARAVRILASAAGAMILGMRRVEPVRAATNCPGDTHPRG